MGMKIVFYCQHVLGVGHFFRSLEICRALAGNEVILVTGGPRFEVQLPGHIRELRLPELGMDPEFKQLLAAPGDDIETVKRVRQARLLALFEAERPELFVVELYPFGRKAFRFEIDPVLKAIAEGGRACGVVCSVRDILVEKRMPAEHEARVVAVLNRHFDAVLVHADPKLVALEETFGRLGEIRVPVVYTGFVTPAPAPDGRPRIRSRLGLAETEKLIVASAGGGSVGLPVLEAAVQAFLRLGPGKAARLVVFTGPFMPEADVARLTAWAGRPGGHPALYTRLPRLPGGSRPVAEHGGVQHHHESAGRTGAGPGVALRPEPRAAAALRASGRPGRPAGARGP